MRGFHIVHISEKVIAGHSDEAPLPITRGHSYKLYKKHFSPTVRAKFSSLRVVSVWNNLPDIVDFSTLTSFIRTTKTVDLSEHLSYC